MTLRETSKNDDCHDTGKVTHSRFGALNNGILINPPTDQNREKRQPTGQSFSSIRFPLPAFAANQPGSPKSPGARTKHSVHTDGDSNWSFSLSTGLSTTWALGRGGLEPRKRAELRPRPRPFFEVSPLKPSKREPNRNPNR